MRVAILDDAGGPNDAALGLLEARTHVLGRSITERSAPNTFRLADFANVSDARGGLTGMRADRPTGAKRTALFQGAASCAIIPTRSTSVLEGHATRRRHIALEQTLQADENDRRKSKRRRRS